MSHFFNRGGNNCNTSACGVGQNSNAQYQGYPTSNQPYQGQQCASGQPSMGACNTYGQTLSNCNTLIMPSQCNPTVQYGQQAVKFPDPTNEKQSATSVKDLVDLGLLKKNNDGSIEFNINAKGDAPIAFSSENTYKNGVKGKAQTMDVINTAGLDSAGKKITSTDNDSSVAWEVKSNLKPDGTRNVFLTTQPGITKFRIDANNQTYVVDKAEFEAAWSARNQTKNVPAPPVPGDDLPLAEPKKDISTDNKAKSQEKDTTVIEAPNPPVERPIEEINKDGEKNQKTDPIVPKVPNDLNPSNGPDNTVPPLPIEVEEPIKDANAKDTNTPPADAANPEKDKTAESTDELDAKKPPTPEDSPAAEKIPLEVESVPEVVLTEEQKRIGSAVINSVVESLGGLFRGPTKTPETPSDSSKAPPAENPVDDASLNQKAAEKLPTDLEDPGVPPPPELPVEEKPAEKDASGAEKKADIKLSEEEKKMGADAINAVFNSLGNLLQWPKQTPETSSDTNNAPPAESPVEEKPADKDASGAETKSDTELSEEEKRLGAAVIDGVFKSLGNLLQWPNQTPEAPPAESPVEENASGNKSDETKRKTNASEPIPLDTEEDTVKNNQTISTVGSKVDGDVSIKIEGKTYSVTMGGHLEAGVNSVAIFSLNAVEGVGVTEDSLNNPSPVLSELKAAHSRVVEAQTRYLEQGTENEEHITNTEKNFASALSDKYKELINESELTAEKMSNFKTILDNFEKEYELRKKAADTPSPF